MADYAISNVPRRVVYAPSGVGPYAFTFEILDQTDIAVYRGSTLLTLTTDYTVTINANGTGSVTLVLTAGTSNITIVGSKNIQRTTDFTTGGDLFANTLNDELDNQTIFIQQVAETAERGLKAPVTDPTDIAMTLPAKDGRKGKVLAFDSTTGNPVAGPSLDSVVTVIEQSENINTVADNIADVIAVADNETNINTVAGVSSNVTTVAGSISNVNTVADDLNEAVSEINTVGTNITNVNTVGNNIANVNTVAGISANVTTVAGISANVTTVAGIAPAVSNVSSISAAVSGVDANATDISAVNANKTNIDTVAGIAANVTTVAGISANVTSVAGNSTNINTVATNIANVNSVGTNIANVNSVAGNATNINAVAGNSTNINTVAGISANVTTVATNNANVTTVAGSIANVNTNATNIANINQNAANIVAIQNASTNATAAANSATAAAGSATSASASAAAASAVALGSEPVRHSVRPSLLLDFANTKTLDPRITFTRASTGTFYDGKTVAKAEENLLLQSQDFTTTWGATNATVTANTQVSPDGTTTADTITRVGTVNSNVAQAGTRSALTHVASVFAKAGTQDFMAIQINTNGTTRASFITFNLTNGAIGTEQTLTTNVGLTATATSFGNGWYRCSVLYTSLGGSDNFIINPASTADTRNGTDGGTIYAWGAQLEQRDAVTAYTATTTAPITNYIPTLQTAASGVARFEHNPITGESLGLEIEEQRTNLLTYSSQFDDAAWTKNRASVISNTVVAPDGTLTGDKLVEDTSASNTHQIFNSQSLSAGTYTISFFAKAAERTKVSLNRATVDINVESWPVFDLIAGSATNNGVITAVGNGWFRCSFKIVVNTTASTAANIQISDGSSVVYTGDGYSGVYIWGAQLEAGAFATSYIPTVASQVTRSADSAVMTGTNFSSWYRADEGAIFADGVWNGVGDNTYGFWGLSSGASSNRMISVVGTALHLFVDVNSANQVNIDAGTAAANTTLKMASVYKLNDFASVINGGTVGTDTSGIIPVVNTFGIGNWSYGSAGTLNGTIKKLAYYPKRLTNAELQGLTTV